MDVAYNRIEIDGTQFARSGSFGETLSGKFNGSANVLSLGASRKF